MNKEGYQHHNLDVYIEQIREANAEQKYQNKAGIYCIKILGQIVYIGKSTNLLTRVASHMKHICENTPESKANKYQVLKQAWERDIPVEFNVLYYTIKSDPEDIEEDIGEAEGQFIRYYNPMFNYQIPREDNWRKYTCNKFSQVATLDDVLELAQKKHEEAKRQFKESLNHSDLPLG